MRKATPNWWFKSSITATGVGKNGKFDEWGYENQLNIDNYGRFDPILHRPLPLTNKIQKRLYT